MLKVLMLAGVLASMTMASNVAVNSSAVKAKDLNAEIIVTVDRDMETLTKEGIRNTQNTVMYNIRKYATNNFSLINRYENILNAFAIKVNEDDINLIRSVPGVKSVTLNELHWKTEVYADGAVVTSGGEGTVGGEYGDETNISAETMYKPDNTNDGAGTTIAILDNEFYLRGSVYNKQTGETTPAWNHETYTPIDTTKVGVKVKANQMPDKFDSTIAYKYLFNSGLYSSVKGREGSLYFNNKVPFYFDYGGEIDTYSADPRMDADVSSTMTYHGSHVSSIAAGNADTYKGIAPNAQLFCMKVFTCFKASEIDKKMGITSYSGAYDLPIMNALEDCITLGVDGINMSLGSNLDDFDEDSATRVVLKRLTDKGIMTSISAGNSGKSSYSQTGGYANWTTSMTETGILSGNSNAPGAMAVAAGQPTKIFYDTGFDLGGNTVAYADQIVNSDISDADYDVEYKMEDVFKDASGGYTKNVDWVYIPGFGRSSDYPIGVDFSDKIVVVNRGNTSFEEKFKVASAMQAKGMILINNDPTSSDFNFHCSFGDTKPDMPIALVLYKDKPYFEEEKSGTISLIRKRLIENEKAYTVSSFSSDGATYDLDLKPEITAPGENIRGAVPPQKTEDQTEERKYYVYEYLSGTSMSAPNYAGAQSVVLSKEAAQYYEGEHVATKTQKAKIEAYRKTVDMRLMSTADPMKEAVTDEDPNPELASPRRQGAGMVNLDDAYNTDTYLEGYDLNGNLIGKSKIALRNNPNINKGIIDITFMAHNEGTAAHNYDAKLIVMRPEIALANDIVTKDYNKVADIETIVSFPGHIYYVSDAQGGCEPKQSEGTAAYRDVFNVTKDIEYYASAADFMSDTKTIIKKDRYYNASTVEGQYDWQPLPDKEYISTKDDVIAEVPLGVVNIPKGDTQITLDSYEITAAEKNYISEHFDYGCYLEGYVVLESKETGGIDLSMPFMGFYSSLNETGGTYETCGVAEPFSFLKDETAVYPSDLANDIAYSLLGKDKHDMGSMWTVGYLEQGKKLDVNPILENDNNFANLSGFHLIGTDPATGEYFDDVSNNLYVGNPNKTNTMIVQQFMLRSVTDNFFTIKNVKTGKTVYKSALEDILFGERGGKYPLYKSHIDDSYLGAGYVSHRAYGVIPLYDMETGIAFESGNYEIEFNYLLAGTGTWVKDSYKFVLDSSSPEVSSVSVSGDKVSFNIKDQNLSKVQVGKFMREFVKTGADSYRVDVDKSEILDELLSNLNEYQGSGRLYIKLTDKAYGEMGTIIRFKVNGFDVEGNPTYDLSKYVMVQNPHFVYSNDFEDDGIDIDLVNYNSSTSSETPLYVDGFVLISRGAVNYGSTSNGCGGNVITSSIIISCIALLGVAALLISKKKRKLGGNK